MPLSKKRMRERKRADRVKPKTSDVKPNDGALQSISRGIKGETNSTLPPVSVQPSDILAAIKCLDNAEVPTDNRLIWTEDDGVQPIPNCPDGRYREG